MQRRVYGIYPIGQVHNLSLAVGSLPECRRGSTAEGPIAPRHVVAVSAGLGYGWPAYWLGQRRESTDHQIRKDKQRTTP